MTYQEAMKMLERLEPSASPVVHDPSEVAAQLTCYTITYRETGHQEHWCHGVRLDCPCDHGAK